MLFLLYIIQFICYTNAEVKKMLPYFERANEKIFITHREKSYNFNAHFHDYIEFAHCFYGFQRMRAGTEEYTLSSGDSIIIFPNTVHEYIKSSNDVPTESISVMCDTDLFSSVIPELTKMRTDAPVITAENIPKNAALAFRKMTECVTSAELTGWAIVALASLSEKLSMAPDPVKPVGKLAPRIIAYIKENYQKPLTIRYLGKEFGYHPSYIAHIFCDQLKIPFRTYLSAARSEAAANMIKSTDKSLTEIAYDCGFGSYNTFSRCFARHFGQLPSAYRNSITKKTAKIMNCPQKSDFVPTFGDT